MRIRPITMAAFMSIGLPIAAIGQQPQEQPADEPQRQLGAHVHGAGKLSIAIEKRVVEIELEAPGSDIVGFEHAAATTDQKQAVARARATLAKPLTLIKLPEAAACKLISAKVKLVGGGSHDGHDHGPAKAKAAAPQHSEFHAEYMFNCAKPELIQAIDLDYFKTFPRAEALDVTFIGAKGQATQHKATKDKPRVEFKGAAG